MGNQNCCGYGSDRDYSSDDTEKYNKKSNGKRNKRNSVRRSRKSVAEDQSPAPSIRFRSSQRMKEDGN
jgi:hypothetical protein